MDSLKKSFKQIGSQVHTKIGGAGGATAGEDKTPILSDLDGMKSIGDSGQKDLELGGGGAPAPAPAAGRIADNNVSPTIWRDASYDFRKDTNGTVGSSTCSNSSNNGGNSFDFHQFEEKYHKRGMEEDDPPSKLIGKFLHKQKLSGDLSLDMELEMDELSGVNDNGLQTISETVTPRDIKVSFQGSPGEMMPEMEALRRQEEEEEANNHIRNRSHSKSREISSNLGSEVVRCTSNASFKSSPNFLRTKTTKSRLLDSPLKSEQDKRSGRILKSAQLKSGMMGRTIEEDEEDPFAGEDLPEDYKKDKFNTMTLCQWACLIIILAAFVCSITIPYFRRKRVWDLGLWKWVLFALVLISGRLVSGWGIRLVVFFIERNFLLRKRVLYFVYGVRKAVQNCLWLGLVLIAWHYILDRKVKEEIKSRTLPYTITKILICLLVATLIWLVKTLLIKVVASSFHVSAYFDRIQESLFNQYVIEKLSGPPSIEIQQNQEEEEKVRVEVRNLQNAGARMPSDLKATMKSGRVIGSGRSPISPQVRKSFGASGRISGPLHEGITIDQLHRLNQKNISAWNMKRLMRIVRRGLLSTLDEQIQDSAHDDDASVQIRNECEAKSAAKKIFHNVAMPGSKYIYLEDLMRFMREDEALKSMSLFEGASEAKKVKKSALKNWVVNAFRERKALALTLDDTKTAVNQLHHMINAVMAFIILIIWLLILGIATSQLLVVVSSQLLLVVFMFGNTCKMVFEAIIFLFVMHPFDVGDRCEIDEVQVIVEEMNILTTVFLRWDNFKISYPNSVLSTKPIYNYYRSPDMLDTIDFSIHISTPAEKMALMKQRIKQYIEEKTEHWNLAPILVAREVEDMNRLKFSLWPTHKMNFHDMGERWVRRGVLVEEMIKIFRELDIEYRMLPRDVNMRGMPAVTSTRFPSTWSSST